MADLSYTVDVNTTPAQRNIDNLNKKINGLTSTFDHLKSALAGLAIGSAISNVNRYADAISDLSDTTGIAIDHIVGLSTAFIQNGGTAEQAQTAVLKFAQTIGDAVDGADTAQKALEQVGVSLKDIQTMSEQDLLRKTIDGLGKMENASMRIATQAAIFGKNARGINFQGVAGGMGSAVESSAKYSAAIKSGADAQQSLEVNMKNLTQALLNVIKPLNDIVASINISVTAFESLVKAITYAVSAYLIFTRGIGLVTAGVSGAIKAVSAAGGVLAAFGAVFVKVGIEIGGFLRMWGRVVTGASNAASVFGALAGTIGLLGRAFLRLLGVVGIVMAIAEAVNFLSKQFFDFDIIDWVVQKFIKLKQVAMDFFNIKPSGPDQTEAETKRLEAQAKAYEENASKVEEFNKRRQKLQQEIAKTGEALKYENEQQLNALALETRLVGKSEEQQESVRAVAELYKKQDDVIKGLLEKRKEWANGTEEQKANLGIIDAEIAKIKELTQTQIEGVTEYISRLQGARLIEQDRVNTLQRITDQMEKQKSLDEAMLQIRQSTQSQLDTAGFEKSQMNRTPLQKQFAQIQEDARKAALEAGRAFAAQFNAEDMGAEDAKKLADGLALIAQRYKEIADAQSANIQQSRTFDQGWKDAFDNYIDNATNAATRASDIFSSMTSNMNSAIDKFVDTGKFSFSDFAKSVIQDLLKIELKAQASMIMKSMGGLGGLFSGIGSILGFAEGGQPPINKPSIVGENGPELFVPKTAGTVVPNGQFGGGGTVNKTYITNNISAVDAKSVAQLFAENRKTLLGTVQLAQKELPYGNR